MTAIIRCLTRLAGIRMFAALVITSGGLFAAPTAEQETAQSALGDKIEVGKEIFEKVIEAQGGRDLLSNIKDSIFRAEYKILPQGVDMTAVYYSKLPDMFRIDMRTMGTSLDIRAFDGKSGWMYNYQTEGVQEMTGETLEEYRNRALSAQGMLNPGMRNISPALEGRIPVEGKDYLVLSYKNWGGFDTVYVLIDPETFLPYKFINLKSDGRTEVINGDYREIKGLKLPYSSTLNIDGQILMEMSIKEWTLNPGLEDSFFEKAAVALTGTWEAKDIDLLGKEIGEPELIHRVEPVLPELAKRARIYGEIVLRITVTEEGTVEDVIVMNGHPLLNQAAVEAVRKWRYKPATHEGKPIPVITAVTVSFDRPALWR